MVDLFITLGLLASNSSPETHNAIKNVITPEMITLQKGTQCTVTRGPHQNKTVTIVGSCIELLNINCATQLDLTKPEHQTFDLGSYILMCANGLDDSESGLAFKKLNKQTSHSSEKPMQPSIPEESRGLFYLVKDDEMQFYAHHTQLQEISSNH